MKVIPEEARYVRKCYFCGRIHDNENPVAFELDNKNSKERSKVFGWFGLLL